MNAPEKLEMIGFGKFGLDNLSGPGKVRKLPQGGSPEGVKLRCASVT
jgi:hypothetical protein